jgi:fructose-specific phosphotransferase system IIA component
MLTIHSLLTPKTVLINPEAEDKSALINMMITALGSCGKVTDQDKLKDDVMAREELSSTGLGYGCAVPHAHSDAVTDTIIAAAVMEEGIDFNSPDGDPARLVFLIVGPKNHTRLHLKLLSKMARFLHDQELRDKLKLTRNPADFLTLLTERED